MTLRLWETTFNDLLIDFHYEFDFDQQNMFMSQGETDAFVRICVPSSDSENLEFLLISWPDLDPNDLDLTANWPL